MNKAIIILSILFLLLGITQNVNAQLRKTIDSLKVIEQNRLDSGIGMLNCSCRFDDEIDSILNVVYSNIRTNLNTQQKGTLKQEELIWLKKREINNKESIKKSKKEDIRGSDVEMIACDNDAEFLINRIFAIINKWDIKKLYSN